MSLLWINLEAPLISFPPFVHAFSQMLDQNHVPSLMEDLGNDFPICPFEATKTKET